MRESAKAFGEQIVVWIVQIKRWKVWLPLLVGIFLGLFIATGLDPTQSATSGWAGLIIGAVLGVIVAVGFDWAAKAVDQILARRPLNKVLGPLATEATTIYIPPLKRPLDSPLFRLDPTTSSIESTRILGTELMAGWWDTIALSLIYATLLKAGKNASTIYINRDSTLDRGQWGKNMVCIGAANARTRAVLDSFQNTYFAFDNDFNAIVARPASHITDSSAIIDGREVVVRYQNKVRCIDGKDYGLILKLKDEARDEGNRIFIIAGLGGDGTAGAAFYLWRNYEKLAALGDTFGVLIETTSGYESARRVEFDSVAISVPIRA
jgi:hypothetical protein